jgi:hypothetical protein
MFGGDGTILGDEMLLRWKMHDHTSARAGEILKVIAEV